jgi:hypothetical protein
VDEPGVGAHAVKEVAAVAPAKVQIEEHDGRKGLLLRPVFQKSERLLRVGLGSK